MIKLLTALAALTMAVPAMAGTAHDFDPSNVNPARSLDEECYTTTSHRDKVCFMRLTAETFTVSIKDSSFPEFPQIMVVDCNAGQYRGYGPLQKAEADAWADHFCKVGRY